MENTKKSGLEAVNKSRKTFSDTQIYRSICVLLSDYMKIYSINSYLGFLKHHKTYNIRYKALFSYWMYCLSKWMIPNKNYNKVEFLII